MRVYQPRIPLRYFQIDPAASRHHDETQVGLDWKYPISELIKLRLTT